MVIGSKKVVTESANDVTRYARVLTVWETGLGVGQSVEEYQNEKRKGVRSGPL